MEYPIRTSTITFRGNNGDDIEAYLAIPEADSPRGGVVVIHHMPGWDRSTKEIARRFATDGYNVVAPHLYSRVAPGAEPDDAAALARSHGGVPDAQVVGDVEGSMSYLRSMPNSNSKVAAIGYCSGGRHTVLSACSLPLDAAVNCYGGFVIEDTPADFPITMKGLSAQLPNLQCPMLGFFGNEDSHPAPEHVEALRQVLIDNGKEFQFHQFDNAGHEFFNVDRPTYRVETALAAYPYLDAFFQLTIG